MPEPGSLFEMPQFSFVRFLSPSETEGVRIEAIGSAAANGETASVAIHSLAVVEAQGAETEAEALIVAEAEADAAEGGAAYATAVTDAEASGNDLVVTKEQETTQAGGDTPAALSITYLDAVQSAAEAFEAVELIVVDQFVLYGTDFTW